MEVEPWMVAVAPVASALLGASVGGFMASRQAKAHWDRTVKMQKWQWEREDAMRWDENRLRVYSEFFSAVMSQRMTLQHIYHQGYESARDFPAVMTGIETVMASLAQVLLVSGSQDVNNAADGIIEALNQLSDAAMKGNSGEWPSLHSVFFERVEGFLDATKQQLKLSMDRPAVVEPSSS